MLKLAFVAVAVMTAAVIPADPSPHLLTWTDLVGRAKPQPDATLSYGTDELQRVDVWLPTGPGPFKTVLMVHGGCWKSNIADRTLMNWVANDLRAHGYAVWNIDYRGVDRPGGGYPGTFEDVSAAADALRSNAIRYDLDIKHVVAVGHSAGGHLALWLAGRHQLPANSVLFAASPLPIAHVISLGGLPDLEATAKAPDNGCGTEVIHELVGATSAKRPDIYSDTSVSRLLPLGVPQDLVNGRDDTIIPLRLATGYQAQAKKAGDHVVLHVVSATGHVELIAPETPAWAETRRLIAAALAS